MSVSPDEEASILERIHKRIDCPVPWCVGSWLEHGGDGQPPEKWFHEESVGVDLGHDAWLSRSQEGGGPIVWSFAMDRHHITEAGSPSDLAQMLRAIADRIDETLR